MKITGSLVVLFATLLFPLTVLITYSMSVYSEHVLPFWPYISYTGDYPVESCIFSLGVNIVAGLYFLIVLLRYNQVNVFLLSQTNKFQSALNKSALVCGWVASFALSTTASVQQHTIRSVHLFGAITCSYSALVYFWHQTYFIWKSTKRMIHYRVTLVALSTILHCAGPIVYIHFLIVSQTTPRENLTGSIMEWVIFAIHQIYIASFYPEFKDVHLSLGEIMFESREVI